MWVSKQMTDTVFSSWFPPVDAGRGQVQRAVPPGQVLVRLVAGLRRHVLRAIQRAEYPLHDPRTDVVPTHQVVDQLIVVAPRAHRATHDVCFDFSRSSTPSPQLIKVVTSHLFSNILLGQTQSIYRFSRAVFDDVIKLKDWKSVRNCVKIELYREKINYSNIYRHNQNQKFYYFVLICCHVNKCAAMAQSIRHLSSFLKLTNQRKVLWHKMFVNENKELFINNIVYEIFCLSYYHFIITENIRKFIM